MLSIILCGFLLLLGSTSVYAQRAPDSQFEYADFVEDDFPFITTSLIASNIGEAYPERNITVRCLALLIGS